MPELIDRQALIVDYRICGGCSGFENCSGHITMCDSARIRQAINEAPTIEAEPMRHGRWIDKGEYAVCTECRERSGTQFDGVEPIALMTQFCPHCGAKMYADGETISKERFAEIMRGAGNG